MRTAQAIAVVLLLLARAVGASDPIPWSEAGNHAGETVTVEGDVAAASSTADQVVLEFAPGDASAFRVVLIIPMMTDLPRFPERLYQGKRVRASGVVRRFRGRPEMVLRSPGQIEVVDVAGPASAAPAAAPPLTTPTPAPRVTAPVEARRPVPAAPVVPAAPAAAPAVPPATVIVPTLPTTTLPAAIVPAPAAAPSTTLPLAPRTEPPTSTLPAPTTTVPPPSPLEALREVRCTRARERWQEAARRAIGLAADLQHCLAAQSYQCRSAAAAMAPALSEIEWAEQQVADACP